MSRTSEPAGKARGTAALAVLAVAAALAQGAPQTAGDQVVELATPTLRARWRAGCVTELRTAAGRLWSASATGDGFGIHLVGRAAPSPAGRWQELAAPGSRAWRGTEFADMEGATGELCVTADAATGDLLVRQRCETRTPGVWGVSWAIGGIPLDCAIIIPGDSGLRLTQETPGREHAFDYPSRWEAGLVIVEGPGGGFAVWAEDLKGRFKRLLVKRDALGWTLRFVTLNDAPFDPLTGCESVPWRLNTFAGDWRVPARRYRDWMAQAFRPVPVATQRPAWVRDIRAMVIMGLNEEILEELPQRFDPAQTILYLPDWRAAGYDRDYPVYDQPRPSLDPFLARAHALGFRVMLHVNYFGVDPLNPLYERFEPYQLRSAWGGHDKQWWLWTRATPEIRFAYINPALKAWRELFVAAMVKLCREHRVDALHLDQTLCIYNDHNGRLDGLSMIDGNILLHQELRQALPGVALSGEGLNEVTFRHEAFAQRHARGLHHAEGTWDRRWLGLAHPVSSYLFRPYVVINGYLGCAPPTAGQLYAAWNEAYEHWGVIPTLKPSLESLRQPAAFARQFLDETAFWLQARLDPDMERDWPADVLFPFRTAEGAAAARMTDGSLVCGERVISRTITGVNRVAAGGSVPGWRAYDQGKLLGLDPAKWYPWFPGEPPSGSFHLCGLPQGAIVEQAFAREQIAFLRLGAVVDRIADLVDRLDDATVLSRPFDPGRPPAGQRGGWTAPDGGGFWRAADTVLGGHPPYKVPGSGEALARYLVDLPRRGQLWFRSEVNLGEGATKQGRSDGVTFACRARAGDEKRRVQTHHASETPAGIELDLTPFAGKRVEIELSVGPGPARTASFDWARWLNPRIERSIAPEGDAGVANGGPWQLALGTDGPADARFQDGVTRFRMPVPGTCVLLRDKPAPAALPQDLCDAKHWSFAMRSGDIAAREPDFTRVSVHPARCGGVERRSFSAHPPDQGETVILFPLTLGATPALVRTWAGLRDGSTSGGVIFRIEVNGQEIARRAMLPGDWATMEADLGKWRGQPVVLGLVTDSDGPYSFDWAAWGEPRLEPGRAN